MFVGLFVCVNSVGYGVRLVAGRADVACIREIVYSVDILIQEGLDQTNCAIVFLLLYFFGMAASLWCVTLLPNFPSLLFSSLPFPSLLVFLFQYFFHISLFAHYFFYFQSD